MGILLNTITAPISIQDVKDSLGATSNDLATLCTDPRINMWAKHKPISSPTVYISQEDWNGSASTSAKSQNYGLIPKAVYLRDLPQTLANGEGDWTYQRPTGGASSPYRLTDFIGYNPNAKALNLSVTVSKEKNFISNTSIDKATVTLSFSPDTDDISVSAKDLPALQNRHLGLMVLDGYGPDFTLDACKMIMLSSQNISKLGASGSVSVSLVANRNELYVGTTYLVFAFLGSSNTTVDNWQTVGCVTIPFAGLNGAVATIKKLSNRTLEVTDGNALVDNTPLIR